MKAVRWLDALYLFFEKFKGGRFVREEIVPQALLGHITGYSVSGYEIRLFCQKKAYSLKHRFPFFPSRRFTAYRVFSTVSNDAPPCLKEACALDLDLPRMVPSFVSEAVQKEIAVQAYLDIIIAQLADRRPAFYSSLSRDF